LPTYVIDGREWQVTDGFEALRHVGGTVSGTLIRGMSNLETVGGNFSANATSLFSLREVGGDLLGPSQLVGFSQLSQLERVGRDLRGTAGDFDALVSLRSVGRDIEVSYSDEVTFVLPALESVGRDVRVTLNDAIGEIDVPSLLSIGRDLRFHSNYNRNLMFGATERARRAFADVEVGGITLICANEQDDPCPYDEACWDVYDE